MKQLLRVGGVQEQMKDAVGVAVGLGRAINVQEQKRCIQEDEWDVV